MSEEEKKLEAELKIYRRAIESIRYSVNEQIQVLPESKNKAVRQALEKLDEELSK